MPGILARRHATLRPVAPVLVAKDTIRGED
jgi:hypothetical protein